MRQAHDPWGGNASCPHQITEQSCVGHAVCSHDPRTGAVQVAPPETPGRPSLLSYSPAGSSRWRRVRFPPGPLGGRVNVTPAHRDSPMGRGSDGPGRSHARTESAPPGATQRAHHTTTQKGTHAMAGRPPSPSQATSPATPNYALQATGTRYATSPSPARHANTTATPTNGRTATRSSSTAPPGTRPTRRSRATSPARCPRG